MIKVNILCVGKVKEKYFSEGIEEYSKRLSKFCDFKIIEVEEENYKNYSDGLKKVILDKEYNRLSPFLKGYVIATAIEGRKLNSEELSDKIVKICSSGESTVTFVIGGSLGFDERIKERANFLLSVSDMTFPHTLFRLLLTEQIYRAFTIKEGVKYHK